MNRTKRAKRVITGCVRPGLAAGLLMLMLFCGGSPLWAKVTLHSGDDEVLSILAYTKHVTDTPALRDRALVLPEVEFEENLPPLALPQEPRHSSLVGDQFRSLQYYELVRVASLRGSSHIHVIVRGWKRALASHFQPGHHLVGHPVHLSWESRSGHHVQHRDVAYVADPFC